MMKSTYCCYIWCLIWALFLVFLGGCAGQGEINQPRASIPDGLSKLFRAESDSPGISRPETLGGYTVMLSKRKNGEMANSLNLYSNAIECVLDNNQSQFGVLPDSEAQDVVDLSFQLNDLRVLESILVSDAGEYSGVFRDCVLSVAMPAIVDSEVALSMAHSRRAFVHLVIYSVTGITGGRIGMHGVFVDDDSVIVATVGVMFPGGIELDYLFVQEMHAELWECYQSMQ